MHLTIIAKQPRPGFVKTRLCPPCSPEQAAAVCAAALLETLDAIDELADRSPHRPERVLLFDGDPTGWARPGYEVLAQRGAHLGERLANGFEELGAGVIVAMDTPSACGSLEAALDAVAAAHDALGLATDGGYWAIGLHRIDAEVFAGVPMSESHTGMAQLRRLHQLGRTVQRLPMARDLDTIDDLRAIAAQHTSAHLGAAAAKVVASFS